jgi:hypothetical protein
MNRAGAEIAPGNTAVRGYHERKHRVFLRMHDDQLSYRDVMS